MRYLDHKKTVKIIRYSNVEEEKKKPQMITSEITDLESAVYEWLLIRAA